MSKQTGKIDLTNPEGFGKYLTETMSDILQDPLKIMSFESCIRAISDQISVTPLFQRIVVNLLGREDRFVSPEWKMEMGAFLHYLVGLRLLGEDDLKSTFSSHYFKMAYEGQRLVMDLSISRSSEVSAMGYSNFVEYSYYYARSLEISCPNSISKMLEVLSLYSRIVRSDITCAAYITKLSRLKTVMLGNETFEGIKILLSELKSDKLSGLVRPFIELEEVWVDLCHKAMYCKATDENPKIQKFLAHIKKKSLQEFDLAEDYINIPEDQKITLTPESPKFLELLGLANRCEILRNAEVVKNYGDNLVSVNKTSALFRIIASEEDYPLPFLRCLEVKDGDALYDFYKDYERYTSEDSEDSEPWKAKYQGDDCKSYCEIAKNSRDSFLEAAAWSGNVNAQYDLAHSYLIKARSIKESVDTEVDPVKKEELLNLVKVSKARWEKFLFLAADNEHAEARFELANAISLGYDEANRDMVDCIIHRDKGFAHRYYKAATVLGHEEAKIKYREDFSKISEINLEEITEDQLEFLRDRSSHDVDLLLYYARCFENGYGMARDIAEAEKLYKVAYHANAIARLSLARIDLEERQSFDEFSELLRNPAYCKEAIDYLKGEVITIETKLLLTRKIRGFCQNPPKQNESQSSIPKELIKTLKHLVKTSFAELSSQGCIEAQIEVTIDVRDETRVVCKVGDEDFTRRQNALLMMIAAMSNDDLEIKKKVAEQILSLLKTPEILPADFSITQIEPFLGENFLQNAAGSKVQFELAEAIEKILEQKSEQEKELWREKISALVKSSSHSTHPCSLAQIKLIDLFIERKDLATLDEFKKIKGWCKSNNVKQWKAMSERLYQVAMTIEDESVKQQYKAEFDSYLKLVDKSEKTALQENCPNWFEDKAVEKKSAPAAGAKPDVEVAVKTSSFKAVPAAALVDKDLRNVEGHEEKPAASKKPGKKLTKQEKKRLKEAEEREKAKAAAKEESGEESDNDFAENRSDLLEIHTPSKTKLTSELNPEPLTPKPLTLTPLEPDSKKISFSVDAPAFIPQKQQHQQQMIDFLAGPRQITSIQDLPEFLQLTLGKVFKQFSAAPESIFILLKGSAICSSKSTRQPNDLDIGVIIAGISAWDDRVVTKFISTNFQIEENQINIYCGPNQDHSEFTVNAKDSERKLDLSFYDSRKMQPSNLGWITSRESEILITQDGAVAKIKPQGLMQHLEERNITDSRFFINPDARSLILRLCFLNTIGEIESDEMDAALSAIGLDKPVDLLLKEFKIDRLEDGNCNSIVHPKVRYFMKTHALDDNLQLTFVTNLLRMAQLDLSKSPIATEVESRAVVDVHYYSQDLRDAFRSAIVSLKEELSKTIIPASTPNVSAYASGKLSVTKEEGLEIGHN